ncbi:hypothetical protein GY45DRAFT_1375549 [Cubamyces sp. BRFM 1775]|nr:hypothetical protein GY45DRAFT_1375549 [Cubamyces sp. BRFM 1775]
MSAKRKLSLMLTSANPAEGFGPSQRKKRNLNRRRFSYKSFYAGGERSNRSCQSMLGASDEFTQPPSSSHIDVRHGDSAATVPATPELCATIATSIVQAPQGHATPREQGISLDQPLTVVEPSVNPDVDMSSPVQGAAALDIRLEQPSTSSAEEMVQDVDMSTVVNTIATARPLVHVDGCTEIYWNPGRGVMGYLVQFVLLFTLLGHKFT